MTLADHTVFDHLLGVDVKLVRAVLRADLDHPIRLLRQTDDIRAFFDRVSDRLFEIDVLVRFQRRHRHRVMEMLRRGDEDHVDVRIGQHVAIVDVGLRSSLFFCLDDVLPFGEIALKRVAHGNDVHQVLARQVHLLHYVLTASSGGNPADAEPVILSKNRQHTGGGNHGHSTFFQDLPAGNFVHSGQVSSESGSIPG